MLHPTLQNKERHSVYGAVPLLIWIPFRFQVVFSGFVILYYSIVSCALSVICAMIVLRCNAAVTGKFERLALPIKGVVLWSIWHT